VPYYTDIEILIEDYKKGEIRVDGMILATPNSMHLSGAITCAKHRIPALIEKPVTATIKEGEELLRVLEKYDNVHMLVGHHRRHSGALATAVNIIQSGQLGKIVSINGNAQFYKPAHYYKTGPWRTLKSTGGGPVLINLIHEMDNLRALCGEVTSVQAMSSNETRSHEVEDTVVINLRFASGALGSFTLSDTATGPMSWEQTSGENKNYGRDFNADCYFIAGTRASLAVPTMKVWKNSGEESDWMKDLERECVFVPDIDPLSKQLSHFVEVIRGNATPIVPVKSAFESLKVVQCVLEAMETGNTVYLSTISSSNKINHADESQI
jgi:predicted dehydrogenase